MRPPPDRGWALNLHLLIGAEVLYRGELGVIVRPPFGRWSLADGRSGVSTSLYLPTSERVVQHVHVCTADGRLTVVDVPELDSPLFDVRPPLLRGGAA